MTALYQAHAVGLIRLAIVMLGDRSAAEDVVQDAFFGLYRRWDGLTDTGNSLPYLRSSVLNRCRNALRDRSRRDDRERAREGSDLADWHGSGGAGGLADDRGGLAQPAGPSAEEAALVSERQRAVLAAIRRLPGRQREALVLRYYLDMSEEETASAMGISRGTVKSATSRAIAALGRMLREGS